MFEPLKFDSSSDDVREEPKSDIMIFQWHQEDE